MHNRFSTPGGTHDTALAPFIILQPLPLPAHISPGCQEAVARSSPRLALWNMCKQCACVPAYIGGKKTHLLVWFAALSTIPMLSSNCRSAAYAKPRHTGELSIKQVHILYAKPPTLLLPPPPLHKATQTPHKQGQKTAQSPTSAAWG
jgi:hypothetical protein